MSDNQEIETRLAAILKTIMDQIDIRFNLLEERVEMAEMVHAQLTLAYGEFATILQALVNTFIGQDEDKLKKFMEDIRSGNKELLNLMNATADVAKRDTKFTATGTDDTEPDDNEDTADE